MSDLSPKQQAALTALLSGHEMETAAAAAGVNVSTLYRWKRSDDFRQALRDAQSELIDDHTAGLVGILRGNRDTLIEIRDDSSQPGHVRLRAVELIESSLRNWLEHKVIAEELDKLWEAIDAQKERN